jgi:hypothetical protein
VEWFGVQVEGTDRGTQIGESEKVAIDEIVSKLESQCIPEPLSSPLLFGGEPLKPLSGHCLFVCLWYLMSRTIFAKGLN